MRFLFVVLCLLVPLVKGHVRTAVITLLVTLGSVLVMAMMFGVSMNEFDTGNSTLLAGVTFLVAAFAALLTPIVGAVVSLLRPATSGSLWRLLRQPGGTDTSTEGRDPTSVEPARFTTCVDCDRRINDALGQCPFCGAALEPSPPK